MSGGHHQAPTPVRDGALRALDARVKILVLLGLIVTAVSTPAGAYPSFAAYALLLLGLGLAARVSPKLVLRRLSLALPFILVVTAFLPFVEPGQQYSLGGGEATRWLIFWNVLSKALLGVFAMTLLMATTPIAELLRGFQQLKVPRSLLLLIAFAARYLEVLVAEARRMRQARDARAYGGRWIWQSRVIGHMIASLFLRAYERGERVYAAMLSRGYEPGAGLPQGPRLRAIDIAAAVAGLLLLGLIRGAAGLDLGL